MKVLSDPRGKSIRRFRLAVNDKHLPGRCFEAMQPGEQGIPVRVRGETAQGVDLRSYRNALAK
jgi:hypothetical protein